MIGPGRGVANRMSHFSVLLACTLAVGCGLAGGDGAGVERADSAGVEIVTSPAQDRPLAWSFRAAFRVGGAEEGPESFYAVWPSGIGVDSAGRIYVLDPRGDRLVVFSESGEFVRTFGSRGEGPGEMASPASLAVSWTGETAVFDYGKLGLVRYDPNGAPLPEAPFPHPPMPNQQRHFAWAGDGATVSTMMPGTAGERVNALLGLRATDTVRLAQVVLPASRMVMYESCGGGLNLPPLFSPEIVWDRQGGRLAVNSVPGYVVDIYEGTRRVRSLRRHLEPAATTRELAIRDLGDGFRINFGRGLCLIPSHEMVDGRGFATPVPLIEHVRVAASGEVWVQRRVVGQPGNGPIDVFDAGGAYVGTLEAGTAMPLLLLPNGRVALEESDELDVERLVVAEIVR